MAVFFLVTLFVAWVWYGSFTKLKPLRKPYWASLIGMALASSSALLAAGALCYSGAIGGFAYYAPKLMRIYACGFLLSTAALFFASVGVFFHNPLRWQAPLAALVTLLFWLGCAATE